MHLGPCLLTHLEHTARTKQIPTNSTVLALELASPVVLRVTYSIPNSIFLTNTSLCVSRVYNNFGQHCLFTRPMLFL